MKEVEPTIKVYDFIVGETGKGRGKVWQSYPRCQVETRGWTYKGVPCIDLPAHWGLVP